MSPRIVVKLSIVDVDVVKVVGKEVAVVVMFVWRLDILEWNICRGSLTIRMGVVNRMKVSPRIVVKLSVVDVDVVKVVGKEVVVVVMVAWRLIILEMKIRRGSLTIGIFVVNRKKAISNIRMVR